MENRGAITSFNSLVQDIGRSAISSLYPKEFEYYMFALELTNSNNETIDYFVFPIMPSYIKKSEPQLINVKKTMGGVSVLTTQTNAIQILTIKGDFGRNFKLNLSPKSPSKSGYAFSINAGKYSKQSVTSGVIDNYNKPFINEIKTGFGALNILRAIISKSTSVDEKGNPFRLYVYNMALGESYLATPTSEGIEIDQSLDKNMIWAYSLSLNIIAPMEMVVNLSKESVFNLMTASAIQRDLSKKINKLTNLLK